MTSTQQGASTSGRRFLGFLAVAAASLLGFLLVRQDREAPAGPAPPLDPPAAVAPPPGPPASPAAVVDPLPPAPPSVAAATYEVVDVTTGEGVAGARFSVKPRSGEDAAVEIVSSPEGALDVPWLEPVEVASADPGIRTVLAPAFLPGDRSGRTLWVYRAATLRVRVHGPDGLPVGGGLRILARPSGRAAGEWMTSPDRLGSRAWFDAVNPALFSGGTSVHGNPALLTVPAGQPASVTAWAPGFGVATVIADAGGVGGGVVDVTLDLLPIRRLHVRVLDPEGRPIPSAQVTHLATRVLEGAAANPEIAVAENALSGLACTFRGKDERLRIQNLAGGAADGTGELDLEQPFPSKDSLLVVSADGYESTVLRDDGTDPPGGIRDVTLKRFSPAAPRYRFLYGGARILGARVCLAEFVGEDLVGLPLSNLGEDGDFPSSRVVPGKEYQLVLMGIQGVEGVTALSGRVTFGSAEEVDVTGLQK